MGEVVDFTSKRTSAKAESTSQGEAHCLLCGHEWIQVAKAGQLFFECPECNTYKGVFRYECVPANGEVFECHCTNQLFHVTEQGIFCPNCGEYMVF